MLRLHDDADTMLRCVIVIASSHHEHCVITIMASRVLVDKAIVLTEHRTLLFQANISTAQKTLWTVLYLLLYKQKYQPFTPCFSLEQKKQHQAIDKLRYFRFTVIKLRHFLILFPESASKSFSYFFNDCWTGGKNDWLTI